MVIRLLANENFPLPSVNYLRGHGHDVLAIGTDYPGITDREIVELATREHRLILTFDRDYGELIFRHQMRPGAGVVYLRQFPHSPLEPGILVAKLLQSGIPLASMLTVMNEDGIRQRQY